MSSNNVAHVSSVDKGLKMKIKRTKVPNKVDSKHEVVKSNMKTQSSCSGQTVAVLSTAAVVSASSSSFSVLPNRVLGNVASLATAGSLITTSLALSSSIPLTSSSLLTSGGMVTSTIMTNPTVSLLKAASGGMPPEVGRDSSLIIPGKPPLKSAPPGVGVSVSDGKSSKSKAAYNKKTADSRGKPDNLVSLVCPLAPGGSSQSGSEVRTCVTMTTSSQTSSTTPSVPLPGCGCPTLTSEPRLGSAVYIKRENPVHDPYEFNAKVEDKIDLPPKKLKLEKTECMESATSPQPHQHPPSPAMVHPQLPPPASPSQQQQQHQSLRRSVGVDVCSVGITTDPDSLGPCEPGTLVGLEGIVWKETDNGLLVVNVTWRGKTYVGTLMDATRYAWAPPRPRGSESPVSDFESRTPKGRGKRACRASVQASERLPEGRRLRKSRRGTANSGSSNFAAPPSPAKSDISTSNLKRKTKASEVDSDKPKRSRSCSRGVTGAESPTPDGYIICPEPNCHKKYKHMNGLRYHRTHAHRKSSVADDEDEDDEEEEKLERKEKTSLSERGERMKTKEKQRMKEQQKNPDRGSKDSPDDDVPLKEIAGKASGQISVQKVDNTATGADRFQEDSNSIIMDGGSGDVSVNATTESQMLPANSRVASQKEQTSSGLDIASSVKKKDTVQEEVSSPSSPLVPCVSSSGEVLASAKSDYSSSKVNLPAVSSVKSHVCQATTAVLELTPQTSSIQNVLLSQAQSLQSSTVFQTSVVNSSGQTLSADRQNVAKGPGSIKSMSYARPIVPAPSPQMGHCQSPQSSTQAHGPTLKPIQPKPTVMGDHSVISPALADLGKDRSRKAKKKKKKDKNSPGISVNSVRDQVSCQESQNTLVEAQDDASMYERPAVMSTDPSNTRGVSSPSNIMSFQSSLDSHNLQATQSSDTPLICRSRVAIPPSSLPVSCPMDSKSTTSDDVHSPAYSDISDANDSSSPLEPDRESPKKDSTHKKDGQVNGAPLLTHDGNSILQHYGSMFYYGGAPDYLSHGLSPQMTPPALSKAQIKSDDVEENRPSSSAENLQIKKEGSRSIKNAEQQQKSFINYYSHLHSIPAAAVQFQLNLAGYNSSPLDPAYAVMVQQPTAAEQRCVMQPDGASKPETSLGKQTPPVMPKINRAVGSGYDSNAKPKIGSALTDGLPVQHQQTTERDKPNENHQILKENSQQGLHQQMGLSQQDQQNLQVLKQQTELLRAQMYQQQKQKIFENQRQDKRKGPPELTTAGHVTSGQFPAAISRHLIDAKVQESILHEGIKKEAFHNKDSPGNDCFLDSADLKRLDVRDENARGKPSTSSQDVASASRTPNQSNTPSIPPVSSATTAPTSMSSSIATSLPVSLVTSLPSGAAFPYASYYPHFRPVQLDPVYKALSSHVLGYSGTPSGYIHQSQFGYRMPPVDPDRKSPDGIEPRRPDACGLVNSAGYSPVHNIHELQDKGRPSPGVHSPVKPGTGDSLTGPTTPGPLPEKVKDKQREYSSSPPTHRHVHTHHHTHVLGGFPTLYPADPYSAMFGHTASAATAIQPGPSPFPSPHPPPQTPKS